MNLWRIPRMDVESPTLLVYKPTKDVAAAKVGTGDISTLLAASGYTIKVHIQSSKWLCCALLQIPYCCGKKL